MPTALQKAMSTTVSPQDIENQITHLVEDVARARRGFNKTFADRTPEGNRKYWESATRRQRERSQQIDTLIRLYGEAATGKAASIRDSLMPTSDDPQVQLVAEMTYQRIMSRPAVKNADNKFTAARSDIMALGPSPARTLILKELVDRGEIQADNVDALIAEESPEYRNAAWSETLARTYQTLLREQLRQINERLDTTPTDGSMGFSLHYATSVIAPTQSGHNESDVAYRLPTTIPMVNGPTVRDVS